MKVTISETTYDKIIKGLEKTVSTDACRPILQYILLKVNKDQLTAYATDGYRMTKVEAPCKSEDEFKCLLRIEKIKVTKAKALDVTITTDGNGFVTIRHDLGFDQYEEKAYKTPEAENFINPDKMEEYIKTARDGKHEKGTNIGYLIDTLTQLAKLGYENALIRIEDSKGDYEPYYLRGIGEDKALKSESCILPIRLYYGKETRYHD